MSNPVEQLEKDLAEFLVTGTGYQRYVLAVSNGTAALHLAIEAFVATETTLWNKNPDWYKPIIITTPFTFPATANAIIHAGAIPFFVDIKPDDYTIDPEQVQRAIQFVKKDWLNHGSLEGDRKWLAGILPVHLFGRMADVKALQDLRWQEGIFVIEDASQAFGAELEGKSAGTFGDAGTFSFYATKNMHVPGGEGGAVAFKDLAPYDRAKMLRNHGFDFRERMQYLGYNYKMPWVCAFLAQQQLKLHKPAILAELTRYGIKDGYYPYLVYEHPWYQLEINKDRWLKLDCPVAEATAKKVREQYMK